MVEGWKNRQTLWLCAALAAVTLLVFWPATRGEFINYDDPDYVTENPHIQAGLNGDVVQWAFTSGYAGNWHPLTWLSHALDISLFGLNPVGHHAVNVVLHALNAVLVFLLFQQLTGARWRSALVAAVFALHPLRVESVAWVSERKDVLCACFGLLCLIAYARYAQTKADSGAQRSDAPYLGPSSILHPLSSRWYWLALACFALGLLSKPMLVTWPFVMLLLDVWPLKRARRWEIGDGSWERERQSTPHPDTPHPASGHLLPSAEKGISPGEAERALNEREDGGWRTAIASWKPLVIEKLPFFALTVASCVITYLVQKAQGAVAPTGLPLESRLANAVLSYFRYLQKFFWPADLAIFYPHPGTNHPELRDWAGPELFVAAAVVAAISFFAIQRARRQPAALTGWLWYVGTAVPVIGILQVGGQAMADRYTYLPMIGVGVMLAWLGAEWFGQDRRAVRIQAGCWVAALGVLAWQTHQHCGRWQDSLTIFGHALAVTQNNSTAHFNYGAALEKQGKVEEALQHYDLAIAAEPMRADAHYNRAHALALLGRRPEAEAAYRTTLEINPQHLQAHNNLATLLHQAGNFEEAAQQYEAAVRIKPDYVIAQCNWARMLVDQGKYVEAAQHYEAALRTAPKSVEALTGLGLTQLVLGKPEVALPLLRQVRAQQPQNVEACLNLANALTEAGQHPEARATYDEALKLNPGIMKETLAAGDALAAKGNTAGAVARYVLAARLDPKNAGAHTKLGQQLAGVGQLAAAVEHFKTAVTLAPGAEAHYNLALALVMQHQGATAAENYRAALRFDTNHLGAMNDLAWLLVTAPEEQLRNGAEAVRLAERARDLSGGKEARYWGTLDAAYAEAGRFDDAIKAAEQTRELATAAGQTDIAKAAEERLKLYRERKAFRQTR